MQEQLAMLLALLEDLRVPSDRALLLDKVELALNQLEFDPPNLVLSRRLSEQLTARRGRGWLLRAARLTVSASPHIVVASGVLVALIISVILAHVCLPLLERPNLKTLQLVTETGFAGSLTSLMLRFNQWRGRGCLSSRDAFFEGLFRPRLLPFQPAVGVTLEHLHAGIAFAAGFSERLSASLVETFTLRGDGRR